MRRGWVVLPAVVAALAATTATAGAQVNAGHSGWNWGNPQPQGNTINDISFNAGTGFAGGDFGTLLSTIDGGQTWTGVATGITPNINKISQFGPGNLVVGGGCTARRTDDGGATFVRLPFNAGDVDCPQNLVSQAFPGDGTTGYLLLSDGSVVSTADGGQTFSPRTAVPGTSAGGGGATATDVTFTSPTQGYAVSSSGNIYRTTDGANSWTSVFSGGSGLNSIIFTSAPVGYAVGTGSTVLKTTNGGTSWSSKGGAVGPGGPIALTKIRCANNDLCLIVNDQGTGLVRTANGGDSYQFVTPAQTPISAAAFATPSRAVAAGANGVTVISDDGGQTFSPVGSSLRGQFYELRASSASNAYAFGPGGSIAATSNGGASWTNLNSPSSADVLGVSFPSGETGYALGEGGSLQRTDNGGLSWRILSTGRGGDPNDVAATNADTVVLIGPRGIRRSTNGAGQFTPVRGRVPGTASLIDAEVQGATIFAYGSRTIVYSGNGGSSWTSIPLPPRGRRGVVAADEVDCVTTRVCWMEGTNDNVYRTTNRGRTWTNLTSSFGRSETFDEISAGSANSAYVPITAFRAGAEGGWVLHTGDGGRTWTPQLVGPQLVQQLAASGQGTDFALAGAQDTGTTNQLFQTTTEGNQGAQSSLTLSASPKTIGRRRTTVSISGRLSPAVGGEQILISPTSGSAQVVTADSNGNFEAEYRISRQTGFVAQWGGDDDRNGDGSPLLTVKQRSSR